MNSNTTDTKTNEQLSGSIPDTVHEDGTITDAIGVPTGMHTRSRLTAREDESEMFAQWANDRVRRNSK